MGIRVNLKGIFKSRSQVSLDLECAGVHYYIGVSLI